MSRIKDSYFLITLWVVLIVLWVNSFNYVFLSEGINYDYYAYDFLIRKIYKPQKNNLIHYLIITNDSYLKVFKENRINRKTIAETIISLEKLGVKQIIFDMIFAYPSSKAEDHLLSRCISNFDNIIQPLGVLENISKESNLFGKSKSGNIELKTHLKLYSSDKFILPQNQFLSHNSILGHINENHDFDGTIRHSRIVFSTDSLYIPSLSLASFLTLQKDSSNIFEITTQSEMKINKKINIPIDKQGRILIPFVGQWGSDFDFVTLEDFLELIKTKRGEAKLRNTLGGKLIIIADVSASASDIGPTSVSSSTPLVMVHSALLNALLNKKFIRKTRVLENFLILNFLLFTLFLLIYKKRRLYFILSFSSAILILSILSILLITKGVFIYYFSILLSLLIAFTLGFILMESIFIKEKKIIELENVRKSFEMKETKHIIDKLIPKNQINFLDYEIAAYLSSAEEVGGDYFDYYKYDDQLTLFLADGSGHGLQAGILVISLKSIINSIGNLQSPSIILSQINSILQKIHFSKLFLCLSVLKIKNDDIIYSIAGLPPIFHYLSEKNTIIEYHTKNIPLGIKSNFNFSEASIKMGKNDVLLIFTDGLNELFNSKKELLGSEKIKLTLLDSKNFTPNEIISQFKILITSWCKGFNQNDDISIVVIKKN